MWIPKDNSARHGEILGDSILIYDIDEGEAWVTFQHEVYEYKLNEVTFAYQTVVNSLIETIEKVAYEKKEKFLGFLPEITKVITEGSC